MMALLIGILAVCAGVVLAALDRPPAGELPAGPPAGPPPAQRPPTRSERVAAPIG